VKTSINWETMARVRDGIPLDDPSLLLNASMEYSTIKNLAASEEINNSEPQPDFVKAMIKSVILMKNQARSIVKDYPEFDNYIAFLQKLSGWHRELKKLKTEPYNETLIELDKTIFQSQYDDRALIGRLTYPGKTKALESITKALQEASLASHQFDKILDDTKERVFRETREFLAIYNSLSSDDISAQAISRFLIQLISACVSKTSVELYTKEFSSLIPHRLRAAVRNEVIKELSRKPLHPSLTTRTQTFLKHASDFMQSLE
jgi:hypothetical protein